MRPQLRKVRMLADDPCCSARLLRPFTSVLEAEGWFPSEVRDLLSALERDERVQTSAVCATLEAAMTLTNDELLGVKASKLASFGDLGLLDYVMGSADDLRSALEAAQRYQRLLDDTLDIVLSATDQRAVVRLDHSVMLPAIAEDHRICALITSHARSWPERMREDMDVWFRHEPPRNSSPYHEVLGPARLHFQASCSGFGFPSRLLDAPLRSRNAKLHAVLRSYADISLANLPKPKSVAERVKGLVANQLASGNFSLEESARSLNMSTRTLGRRLADEGTTFTNIVDELRRSVVLRYVAAHSVGLSEIALLTGFNETPSFYRAFRRWTGTTPLRYRRQHRGDLRGLR